MEDRLSVAIPAYNKGRHIHDSLRQVCVGLQPHDFEVIVVDDGSSDATFAESERLLREGYPVRVVRLAANGGKGAALFHGFGFATGKYVLSSTLIWKLDQPTGCGCWRTGRPASGEGLPLPNGCAAAAVCAEVDQDRRTGALIHCVAKRAF